MGTSAETTSAEERRVFKMTILGRLLEHLGVQMYKRRDVAIAELVANCWDAGASIVTITVPDEGDYDRTSSEIAILDNGRGMTPDAVENHYLVVGRNRRRDEGMDVVDGRKIMGRKGIGKLAGFGIATRMHVTTWQNGRATNITLDLNNLKEEDGHAVDVPIGGTVGPVSPDLADFSESGTKIVLEDLKHKTYLDDEMLREALGRRYSRSIRGRMGILVNGLQAEQPPFDFEFEFPDEGFEEEILPSGDVVEYRYGFTEKPIGWRELRGFTVMARGKTAQAPPFFFDVEGTASGQHGTKYLTGEMHADFLDEGTGDGDLIATDRQEIDWEDERLTELKDFGARLTREALRSRTEKRGKKVEKMVLDMGDFEERILRLEASSQEKVRQFLRKLVQLQQVFWTMCCRRSQP